MDTVQAFENCSINSYKEKRNARQLFREQIKLKHFRNNLDYFKTFFSQK